MADMIARLEGILEEVSSDAALVRAEGGLTYEVLLPAFATAQLASQVGQVVKLHTLHYCESQNQGATLTPRLAGFANMTDRDFFVLFTTCKGIGNRKALRAMAMSTEQIAAGIADRDAALLQSLPEIGRRTAETIIATLHGKVDRFVSAAAFGGGAESASTPVGAGGMAREALEVLMQLGEQRTQAVNWIDQALRDPDDRPEDVEALVARVYRIKGGG
jgi:Holliday junction DNA helicase RuvA